MKCRLIVSLFATASIGLAAQGVAQSGLDKLQGSWVVIAAEGQALPAGLHAGLIITGNKYQGLTDGKVDESGTITVDATKKPMTFDFTLADGKDAGKIQLGIVEAAGDTMTMALSEPGSTTRPASLSEQPLTLAKIKPITKDLEGAWEGVVDANGSPLRLAVKLANGIDGLATGTFISVDEGNTEVPIVAVILRGPRVTLIVPAARGTYDGQLKDGQLTGTWTQGRASLPLVLKRARPSAATTRAASHERTASRTTSEVGSSRKWE